METTQLLRLFPILWLLAATGYPSGTFAQDAWRTTGNSGTDPTTHFLGTTDFVDLVIRTDDAERVRVIGKGQVGIGTDDPRRLLHVETADNVTDSVSYPARLSHVTNEIPEEGFGTGLEFQVGGPGGSDSTVGAIESILTDATIGAEESALLFKTTDVSDDGLATRMSINKDGNVAVGGMPASAKLSVTADSGQPILNLKRSSINPVAQSVMTIDSNDRVRINGEVGIGTQPDAPLHVNGPSSDGTATTTVKIGGGELHTMFLDGDDIDSWIDLSPTTLVPRTLHLNRLSSGDVVLATGGGHVGIGTSNPSHRATIVSEGNSIIERTHVDISELNTVFHRNSNTDGAVGIGFSHSTTSTDVGAAIIHERTGGNSQGNLHFATKSSTGPFADLPIGMSMRSNGNVGIGTTGPNEKLEVAGSGRAFFGDGAAGSRKGLLIDGIQGTNAARIEAYDYGASSGLDLVFNTTGGGNVGIATTDPEARLHVQGNNAANDVLVKDSVVARIGMVATGPDDGVTLIVQARRHEDVKRAEIGTVSDHDLVLFTNEQTRIKIGADGAVCIGNC